MYTEELIEAKLKEEYPHWFNMYYVDYQDNFNNNPKLMAELLDWNRDSLYESIMDRDTWSIIHDVIQELFWEDAEYIVEDFYDVVSDRCHENDTSDPISDMLRNTDDLRVLVKRYSNYDCWSSHDLESRWWYCYEDSYFWQILNQLRINPQDFKKILIDKWIKCIGKWPKKFEHKIPVITAEQLYSELIETAYWWNFTFMAKVSPSDLLFDWEKIVWVTIPKWTYCGTHCHWLWSCSVMEATTWIDFKVTLNEDKYNHWSLELDWDNWYWLDEICGFTDKPRDNELLLHTK